MVTIQVGGVALKMLTDSGANSKIIDDGTWDQLNVKGVKSESQAATQDRTLYPYASSQPLPVKGSLKLSVQWLFVIDTPIKGRGLSLHIGSVKIWH